MAPPRAPKLAINSVPDVAGLALPPGLTSGQPAHLDELKQANLITAKAYQMRLNLQEIYSLNSLELVFERYAVVVA